jgi:hypothetical protein
MKLTSRVSGLGSPSPSLWDELRVSGFRFQVSGFRFRVSGFGSPSPSLWDELRVSGFRFRVSGFGFLVTFSESGTSFVRSEHITIVVVRLSSTADRKNASTAVMMSSSRLSDWWLLFIV